MLLHLNDATAVEDAKHAIDKLVGVHNEWFLAQDGGAPLAIGCAEFDFSIAHGRLIFCSWTESGFRSWRITAWNWTGEKLMLAASRRTGAEQGTLEMARRASARAIVAGIAAARQARCLRLAQIASEALLNARIESAALSPGMRRDQPGRFARIVLRRAHERIALTATVANSDARNVDSLFSSALLWFNRLQSRLRQFPAVAEHEAIERVKQLIALRPQAIDLVSSRHGQTLRYHGLPFARVRRVMDRDRIWFGIEGSRRRLLDDYHEQDWIKLFRDLEDHRNGDCRDKSHWFYPAAGAAWLESILPPHLPNLH